MNLFDEIVISDNNTEFSDKELEEINWNANILHITYDELVSFLKEKFDDGTISSKEDAKNILFDFCKEKVVNMVKNDPDFAEANLTDDEAFAASFFEAL